MPEFTGGNHFITMAYGLLDPNENKVTFTRCGHPSPWLLHHDGSSECLRSNMPAFGIYRDVNYIDEIKNISHGDILVIYTDGVVDTENQKSKAFGIKKLTKVVAKNRELSARKLIQEVINQTRLFSGYQPFRDDFTLVILKSGR